MFQKKKMLMIKPEYLKAPIKQDNTPDVFISFIRTFFYLILLYIMKLSVFVSLSVEV